MNRRLKTRISLALLASALAAAMALVAGEPAAEPAAPPETGTAAESTAVVESLPRETAAPPASGLRVYLDAETGELRSRPAEPERAGARLDPTARLNTYGRDLLQEPLEQGGFKVDLRGRFQSAVVATIDPETDEVTLDCVAVPVSGEREKTDDE